jgi:ABC-type Fe3+-hydroxamate transport system substrate-binding protein
MAVATAAVAMLTLASCSSSGQSGGTNASSASGSTAPGQSAKFPVTITDAVGHKHTFDKPVTKIGCYWAGCDEDLADLGLVPAASSNIQNENGKLVYPLGQPSADITKMGGEDNPESWAAAGVDLIVVRGPANADIKAFESVAPVLYLYAPGFDDSTPYKGLKGYEQNLRLLAEVTGRPDAADKAIKRFDTFMSALKAKAPANAAKATVAAIFQSNDGTYTLVGPTSPFCVGLVQYGMGRCVESASRNATSWQINSEAFLALNPDWIVYMGGESGKSTSWVKRSDATWKKLSAVLARHVYDDPAAREYCCSMRVLAPTYQLYGYQVWGSGSGVADPGAILDYNYTDKSSPVAGS